jgi:ketosteroid isomerase-like protein
VIGAKAVRAIRELADREAIRELVSRYAHCVWRRDALGAAALFTDDGEMDTGDGRILKGRAAIMQAYEPAFARMDLQPFVHDHLIELEGDAATGLCHLDLRAVVGGRSMIGAGVYEDEYMRGPEGWRFRSRRLTMKFFVPLEDGWSSDQK